MPLDELLPGATEFIQEQERFGRGLEEREFERVRRGGLTAAQQQHVYALDPTLRFAQEHPIPAMIIDMVLGGQSHSPERRKNAVQTAQQYSEYNVESARKMVEDRWKEEERLRKQRKHESDMFFEKAKREQLEFEEQFYKDLDAGKKLGRGAYARAGLKYPEEDKPDKPLDPYRGSDEEFLIREVYSDAEKKGLPKPSLEEVMTEVNRLQGIGKGKDQEDLFSNAYKQSAKSISIITDELLGTDKKGKPLFPEGTAAHNARQRELSIHRNSMLQEELNVFKDNPTLLLRSPYAVTWDFIRNHPSVVEQFDLINQEKLSQGQKPYATVDEMIQEEITPDNIGILLEKLVE